MAKKRGRKRYWIDGQIQGALAARVAVHWLIFGGIAAVLTLMLQYMANPLAPFSEQLNTVWNNQGPFAIVMAILLPIFVFDTVKLSNRFAGPVLRMRRIMSSIAEGKPAERLTFRDNDFWRGMASDFNKLIELGYFERNEPKQEFNEEREPQEVG